MPGVSKKRRRPADSTNGTEASPPSTRARLHDTDDYGSPVVELNTVSDLIQARASEAELKDKPIVFYPSSGTNYVGYSPTDIYELSSKAATYYNRIAPQRTSSDEPPQVVAVLGPSNIDYLIGILGLSKLGHTILFLSARLSEEAYVFLLNVCKAACLFVDDDFRSMGDKVSSHFSNLPVHWMASQEDFKVCKELRSLDNRLDSLRERNNVAWIIHSSGSTSLPKPNYQTHAAALGNFKSQFHLVGFITLPLFHMQGLGCIFRSIMNRKPIYMYNAALPLTSQHLKTTLREHPDIQILYGVPYAMKLLADSYEGIESCKKLEVLFCGGGACPKPIGDKLVQNGVYLVSHLGSSETGQLMNSYRPRSEIEEWDWLRPPTTLQPYLRWEPYDRENDIFELVVLEGWPSKVATNREDGAYATNDLWERHPDYPAKNAWRYYARKDDTIVLSNGEKANPNNFEDAARESPMVDDAIAFGSQKPHLGMFIIATDPSSSLHEIVDGIWPTIQKSNQLAPAHAQLSKDMIRLLSHEDKKRIRRTDKSGLIRPAFYVEFAPLIDALYEAPKRHGSLVLDEHDLRLFLRKEIEEMIEFNRRQMVRDETDLFSLGIDSLQASRIRSAVLNHIDIGHQDLGANFVFDFPSISAMAAELLRMRMGGKEQHESRIEDRMKSLIHKYGTEFPRHHPTSGHPGQCVLVTGATGSLGIHIVAELAERAEILRIYCLVRARSNDDARERIRTSLNERLLEMDMGRLQAFAADLSNAQLGLSDADYIELVENVTCVLHCAWNVNFNLGLESFEQDCIGGNRHLIELCLKSKRTMPADFIFCSSISTYVKRPDLLIPEEFSSSLGVAPDIGYAQSKLVAEHICLNASQETGMFVRVLRIGQIVGDTAAGIWNSHEAIPMIIQSAKTIGALPMLDEECSWLPVDTVAAAVVEMWSNSKNEKGGQASDVYNVVNTNTFHWTKDLLPMLRSVGLEFDSVEPRDWLRRLRDCSDPIVNPPYKLIEFFSAKYDKQPNSKLKYMSGKARAASSTLSKAPELDQNMVNKFVKHIMRKLPQ